MAGGGLGLGGRLTRRAIAQEPQGPGLLPPMLGRRETSATSSALGAPRPGGQPQIRLAQPGDHECQNPRVAPGDRLLHPLFPQCQTRGDTPVPLRPVSAAAGP